MDGSGSQEAALPDPVKTNSDSHLSGCSSSSDSGSDEGSTSGSSDPNSSTDDGTDSDSSSSDTDSDCEGADLRTCSSNEADTNRPTGVTAQQQTPKQQSTKQQTPKQDAARQGRAKAVPQISPSAALLLQAPMPPGMPRFVRCHCAFVLTALRLPSQLSSQLTGVASGTDVQLLLTAHSADWSPEQYLLSRPPNSSHSPKAGQSQAAAASQASSSTTLGPLVVEAKLGQGGRTRLHAEVHQDPLGKYTRRSQPYVLVLCEQLSATTLHLHIQRKKAGAPKPGHAGGVSLAGGGMGLQVFPGSIQEVKSDVTVAFRRERAITLDLPKALVVSQLPGATFPLDITVHVMEQQDNTAVVAVASSSTEQQQKARLHKTGSKYANYRLRAHHSHPLSALVGCKVVRMQLTPDRRLTLTLEAQPEAGAQTPPEGHPKHSSGNDMKTRGVTPAAAAAAGGSSQHKRRRTAASAAGGDEAAPPPSTPPPPPLSRAPAAAGLSPQALQGSNLAAATAAAASAGGATKKRKRPAASSVGGDNPAPPPSSPAAAAVAAAAAAAQQRDGAGKVSPVATPASTTDRGRKRPGSKAGRGQVVGAGSDGATAAPAAAAACEAGREKRIKAEPQPQQQQQQQQHPEGTGPCAAGQHAAAAVASGEVHGAGTPASAGASAAAAAAAAGSGGWEVKLEPGVEAAAAGLVDRQLDEARQHGEQAGAAAAQTVCPATPAAAAAGGAVLLGGPTPQQGEGGGSRQVCSLVAVIKQEADADGAAAAAAFNTGCEKRFKAPRQPQQQKQQHQHPEGTGASAAGRHAAAAAADADAAATSPAAVASGEARGPDTPAPAQTAAGAAGLCGPQQAPIAAAPPSLEASPFRGSDPPSPAAAAAGSGGREVKVEPSVEAAAAGLVDRQPGEARQHGKQAGVAAAQTVCPATPAPAAAPVEGAVLLDNSALQQGGGGGSSLVAAIKQEAHADGAAAAATGREQPPQGVSLPPPAAAAARAAMGSSGSSKQHGTSQLPVVASDARPSLADTAAADPASTSQLQQVLGSSTPAGKQHRLPSSPTQAGIHGSTQKQKEQAVGPGAAAAASARFPTASGALQGRPTAPVPAAAAPQVGVRLMAGDREIGFLVGGCLIQPDSPQYAALLNPQEHRSTGPGLNSGAPAGLTLSGARGSQGTAPDAQTPGTANKAAGGTDRAAAAADAAGGADEQLGASLAAATAQALNRALATAAAAAAVAAGDAAAAPVAEAVDLTADDELQGCVDDTALQGASGVMVGDKALGNPTQTHSGLLLLLLLRGPVRR